TVGWLSVWTSTRISHASPLFRDGTDCGRDGRSYRCWASWPRRGEGRRHIGIARPAGAGTGRPWPLRGEETVRDTQARVWAWVLCEAMVSGAWRGEVRGGARRPVPRPPVHYGRSGAPPRAARLHAAVMDEERCGPRAAGAPSEARDAARCLCAVHRRGG